MCGFVGSSIGVLFLGPQSVNSRVLLPPMASSPEPGSPREPAGGVGSAGDISGDVLSDWKGGWNTLTENLHKNMRDGI